MTTENPAESLSQVLQWACSPRGGNNFWGRILNGCGRRCVPGLGTAAVSLTRDGKFMFLWDPQFFTEIPMPLRIMVVIHEAGHIVLSHIERSIGLKQRCNSNNFQWNQLFPLINIAQDMAVNDVALRPLVDLANFRDHKQHLMFPENLPYEFPRNESFEEYLARLIQKCKDDGYDPNQQETDGEGNAVIEIHGVPVPMDSKSDGAPQPSNQIGQGKHPVNQAPDWLKDARQGLMPQHIDWQSLLDAMTDA